MQVEELNPNKRRPRNHQLSDPNKRTSLTHLPRDRIRSLLNKLLNKILR